MRITSVLAALTVLVAAGCAENDDGNTFAPDPAGPEPEARLERSGAAGLVFTASNAPGGNEVLVFSRSPQGRLSGPSAVSTGGAGTGAGLGNQGGMIVSQDGSYLLVVNAGSHDVSVFRIGGQGIELVDRESSGGTTPISIAQHGQLVYVLNAGDEGNVAGFRFQHGRLSPIEGSSRPLSDAGVGPAQIQFSPDGRVLVVTEKATNRITTYRVWRSGLASAPTAHPSAGQTPFGFAFAGRRLMVVSEAFGGATDLSAASSYWVSPGGELRLVSPSVGTTETAACWVIVTSNGRYAYTTNTGSNSITGYRIVGGQLSLLDADGVTGSTDGGPIDMAISGNRFLYSLNAGGHSLSGFLIRSDGSLEALGSTAGLPDGANGLAAR